MINDPSNHQYADQGLYDPRFEHDACGVGLICHIKGQKSHDIIRDGMKILENLTHRGACGCNETTGDGAGILMQMPHEFLRSCCQVQDIRLPAKEHYGCGLVFLPRDAELRKHLMDRFEFVVREEGQRLIGCRKVPVDSDALGELARSQEPVIEQIFIGRGPHVTDSAHFERKLFIIRKVMENFARKADHGNAAYFHAVSPAGL